MPFLYRFAACTSAEHCASVQAAEFLFGTNSLSYPTLLFPILSLGFLSAATVNSVQAVSWPCECGLDSLQKRLLMLLYASKNQSRAGLSSFEVKPAQWGRCAGAIMGATAMM